MAITAHVHIADKFEQTSAVLVQVKKPEATENGFRDAWRIDGSQLNDVPKFSQTAVYGLIMPEGTIGVVPARYLAGLRRARPDPPAVMTVSHAHIRSATIPVAQFLVELVLGYVS
ncbi:MAG: hypothetical protein MI923_21350 [Phycisphaerales bacterium]|nr:hypothetical protein [Phycisphaerales bacterium]